MVQVAIEDQLNFKAENIEFGMPQPSYTIDTLVRLKEKHPNHIFSLLLGEDNIRTFSKWKNHEQILDKHTLYVYPRSEPIADETTRISHENVVYCENVPMLNISASLIRKKRKENKSIQYLVTDPVRKYIEEMHFYKK